MTTDQKIQTKNIFHPGLAGTYVEQNAKEPHPYLAKIREDCEQHKWNFMLTTREQAAFLYTQAKILKANRILEIGSFFGHSTLALAAALPETGKLITIEHNPKFAEKTRSHLKSAGLSDRLDLFVGEAINMLAEVEKKYSSELFDLVFIDADKRHYNVYWEFALKILKTGGLVIVDNVLARGAAALPSQDPSSHVEAIKKFNQYVLNDKRTFSYVSSTADGMLIALKL